VEPKIRERQLRNCVNWQGTLQQRGVQETGVKQWLGVLLTNTRTCEKSPSLFTKLSRNWQKTNLNEDGELVMSD
jgi:hypothetical protein